jgi:hypothetical protein
VCETKFHTHTKTTGKIMGFVYFSLQVYKEEMGREEALSKMVASIP